MQYDDHDLVTQTEQSLMHPNDYRGAGHQPSKQFSNKNHQKNVEHSRSDSESNKLKMQCDIDDNDNNGRFYFIKSPYLFQECGISDDDGR